jgi:hypothetical protein
MDSLLAVAIDDWKPDPDYAKYPDHDLHEVPLVVLEAGRAYMRLAASLGDVAQDDAEPLADSVIGAALPLIHEWLQATLASPNSSASTTVDPSRRPANPEG